MAHGRERLVEAFLKAAAALAGATVFGILLFLLYFCLPLFDGDGLRAILSSDWRPFHGHYGILPMVVGSLLMSLFALLVAFPAAVGVCAFAHGLGPPPLARAVLVVVHFMTSIPTIVYAFVSAILLVPFVRSAFGGGSGYSLLAGTCVLSVLILPTIVLMIHAWWRGAGPGIRVTCATLGLTRTQEIFWVLLPASARALFVAAILGFGRAVGDTMIALLLAGNAPQFPSSPLESIRTLTAHIALVLAVDAESTAYLSVFASGLILLLVTAGLHLAARWVRALARAGHETSPR
ncbi:MAG: PstC family ABC transporter permease [Planctomycetota bacterium]|jgi:phosphate transport system permease protein